MGCGKCKGVVRPLNSAGYCPACKTQNDSNDTVCKKCGMNLPLAAGVSSIGANKIAISAR